MAKAQVDGECLFAVWPPKVESIEELDQVLAELGRLDRIQTRSRTELQSAIDKLTAEAEGVLIVELEGADEPLTFAEWREKLEDAAEKFADKKREEILEEGRKSRELNHGKFGWRGGKLSLEALPDFDKDGNPKILDAILGELRTALQKLADFVQGGGRFIECSLSWRKTDLLKAYKDKDVGVSVLKKAGFEPKDPSEKFFLTPESKSLESL